LEAFSVAKQRRARPVPTRTGTLCDTSRQSIATHSFLRREGLHTAKLDAWKATAEGALSSSTSSSSAAAAAKRKASLESKRIATLGARPSCSCSSRPSPPVGRRRPHTATCLGDGTCDPRIGLTEPLATCSTTKPCRRLLSLYERREIVAPAEASTPPRCLTTAEGRPAFDDGSPRSIVADDGVERSWCELRPAGATATAPRPLVVFTTGSGGSADDVYDSTSLRSKAATFDLGTGRGFVLASLQPRNPHWPGDER